MKIWIPTKCEIENMIADMAEKLKRANEVSDIREWLIDRLCELDCHVDNRAGIETGEIAEHTTFRTGEYLTTKPKRDTIA